MIKILKRIEEVLNSNNVVFSKKNNIFRVVYRGINDKNNRIPIYMNVEEEIGIIQFSFKEEINKEEQIDTIKTKLLDLNSSLSSGNLSMRSNSNVIEYRLNFHLQDVTFSFENYNLYIITCIRIYESLQMEKII